MNISANFCSRLNRAGLIGSSAGRGSHHLVVDDVAAGAVSAEKNRRPANALLIGFVCVVGVVKVRNACLTIIEKNMNTESTKRLRLIVEERQRLEGLVSKESTEQRDMEKLLLGLGKFFDQVYLYFLSSKQNSYAMGELSTALEQRSLNQKVHFKTAKLGLRLLAGEFVVCCYKKLTVFSDAIPEWCQINDAGDERFVVFVTKKLKPSTLRAKVVALAQQKLDDDDKLNRQ